VVEFQDGYAAFRAGFEVMGMIWEMAMRHRHRLANYGKSGDGKGQDAYRATF